MVKTIQTAFDTIEEDNMYYLVIFWAFWSFGTVSGLHLFWVLQQSQSESSDLDGVLFWNNTHYI